MKKLMFAILGILTALVIFHSDITNSFAHFLNNVRLLLSFSIVALTSAYAYFFIHKVLHQEQSDE
jgi:hypothetical protein